MTGSELPQFGDGYKFVYDGNLHGKTGTSLLWSSSSGNNTDSNGSQTLPDLLNAQLLALLQSMPESSVTQHKPVAQSPIIIPDPSENPNPVSVQPMVTRFHVGTNRPTERLTLHVSSVSPLPKSYHDAFSDPNWQNAMRDEYHALIKNKTWTLVPRPPDTNIVRCIWLFRHKYLADGTLSRYKARLVGNGSTQLEGVDVDEILWIIRSLHQEFAMTDLGPLNYFLGISVTRDSSGLFLSQKKYAVEILEKVHMVNCNPSQTPVDTESKLGVDGDPVSGSTLYQSLACSLQYLTFTRPDISYAGTLHYGLQLFSSSITDLVAYSDADWDGCPTTRRSTSAYCVFLGNHLLSWSSKCQMTLSRSSVEAEYHGVANAVAETFYLCCNPVKNQRTKHIKLDIHFVRDLVAAGQVRVLHVPPRYQFAYIFTKGLSSALFEEF
ncbi:ribonuclease H-like domain-containing protein [Tanacetum coccineum]